MDAMRPAWRDHAASAYLEGVIAFVDGPPHQKIRKALMPGWTKPEMERLRPQLRELNERLVDEFVARGGGNFYRDLALPMAERSEEHTSELQSLMRHSYAVLCLKKKKNTKTDDRIAQESNTCKKNTLLS